MNLLKKPMEKHLITSNDNLVLPPSLMTLLPSLPEDLIQVAKAKYNGSRFRNIGADDFDLTCKTVLAKICATTGWDMPTNEFSRKAIINVFISWTKEQLIDLTAEEICYAIRRFGLGIKDWGKSINLQMINEPVQEYLLLRSKLSEMEERHAVYLGSGNTKRADIKSWEEILEAVKAMNPESEYYKLVPWSSLYDWLIANGRINPSVDEKKEAMYAAREIEIHTLTGLKIGNKATPDQRADLERLKCIDWKKDEAAKRLLITGSKTIIVKKYLIDK